MSDWDWLIGPSKLPILIAATGDAFLQDTDTGQISLLDVMGGEEHPVASGIEEFRALLGQKEFVGDCLDVRMIGDLIQSGLRLGPGQVYGLKKPLPLGGEVVLENLEPIDMEVHFSINGQLRKKVQALPPGTPVNQISIE